MRRLWTIALCGWLWAPLVASAQLADPFADDAPAASTPAPASGPAPTPAPAAESGEPGQPTEPGQPGEPREDVTARAKARFKDGVAAFEAGQYEEALAAFEEANQLKPHPSVALNIANCHDKLGHPVQAIEHYERFLEHGNSSPAQRAEIVAALKRLRAQLGTLVVRVRPEGAYVSVDGAAAQPSSEAPLTLAAGAHVIDAMLQGHQSTRRNVELAAGAHVELDIVLDPELAPVAAVPAPVSTQVQAPPPATEPSADEGGGGVPVAAWVTGGVTVAVLAGALATGLLALDANSEFDDQVVRRHRMDISSTERILAYNAARDAADRAQTLAVVTDVLLGAGVVGAGLTIYFLLAGDDAGAGDADASADGGRAHAARAVTFTGDGVRIAF